MNYEDIITRLRAPFGSREIEWKLQITTQDKARGMAVAYMDARAVQKRLDEVIGPFNWKNIYSLWHDNSQICGISIYNAERNEWVTKFDGAENSDIEPIKGGLSDSFKRAACVWGIGRYLYDMDGIWVEIEPKGKSYAIKQNQYSVLEREYNAAIGVIFDSQPSQQNAFPSASASAFSGAHNNTSADVHKGAPPNASAGKAAPTPAPNNANAGQPPEKTSTDYRVQSVKPSGKSSQILELISGGGEKVTAYIKASDRAIVAGSRLRKVRMEKKNSSYGAYNLITDYEAA